MSETKNKSKEVPNNVIDYIVYGTEKGLNIEVTGKNEQNANVNDIPGIPMEIKAEDATITNETKDGEVHVIDKKTGKVIGILEKDGTIARNLREEDKKEAREGIEI